MLFEKLAVEFAQEDYLVACEKLPVLYGKMESASGPEERRRLFRLITKAEVDKDYARMIIKENGGTVS